VAIPLHGDAGGPSANQRLNLLDDFWTIAIIRALPPSAAWPGARQRAAAQASRMNSPRRPESGGGNTTKERRV